jgi:membrane-associated protein
MGQVVGGTDVPAPEQSAPRPAVDPADPAPDAVHRRITTKRVLLALLAAAIVGALAWVFFGIGVSSLLEKILHLPSWLILLLVFLLPFSEAAVLIGVFFPGEIAVLLGGVAASQGSVSIAAVLVAACLGAVLGDQVGYVVGREWGEQVLSKLPDRLIDQPKLDKAHAFVRRMGAKGVILGRWTAALRALVPGMAGMARMHYPRFLIANIIGGVGWAVTVGVVGYLAGNSYKKVESALGSVSYGLLGLIVVGFAVFHFRKHLHLRRSAAQAGSKPTSVE